MEKLIILIDDNEIDNFINRMTLKQAGYAGKHHIFNSPLSALEYLSQIPESGTPPDLIFLDIQMPVMNGHQFLAEFGKLNVKIRDNTRIIVLSSSIDPTDIQKCRENTVVLEYLNKPLTIEKLVPSIAQRLGL